MGAAEYFKAVNTIRLDLLDLMGSGYVIEHCITAFSISQQRKLFYQYTTDAIKNINEILAKTYSGAYMTRRYAEYFPDERPEGKEMSGDAIAADIINRAGLKVKGGDSDDTV